MKKDCKNHPFKVGDRVYHYIYGVGKVTSTEEKDLSKRVIVKFESNRYENVYGNDYIQTLSFTPYEIPSNWERPFEPRDGDIITIKGFNSKIVVVIFKSFINPNQIDTYVGIDPYKKIVEGKIFTVYPDTVDQVYYSNITEEQLLFKTLKEEGLSWNENENKIERIPVLKEGDLVIAWDSGCKNVAIIGTLSYITSYEKFKIGHDDWDYAIKFESMEQYEKIKEE